MSANTTSPLSRAIITKSLKTVRLLVENGANINTLDADGASPFHKAVKSKDANLMRYLIQNGANLNVKTVDGDDALGLALKKAKKQQSFKIILQHQPNKF